MYVCTNEQENIYIARTFAFIIIYGSYSTRKEIKACIHSKNLINKITIAFPNKDFLTKTYSQDAH